MGEGLAWCGRVWPGGERAWPGGERTWPGGERAWPGGERQKREILSEKSTKKCAGKMKKS